MAKTTTTNDNEESNLSQKIMRGRKLTEDLTKFLSCDNRTILCGSSYTLTMEFGSGKCCHWSYQWWEKEFALMI